jgi:hypothetical protein
VFAIPQGVYDKLQMRRSIYSALGPYIAPAVCTLHLDTVRKARQQRIPHSAAGVGGVDSRGDGADADAAAPDVAPAGDVDDADAPVRLRLESSPDIAQLPLEYQVT